MSGAAAQFRVAIAAVAAALAISACGGVDDADNPKGPKGGAAANTGKAGNDAVSGTGGSTFGNANTAGHSGAPSVVTDASTIDPGANDCVGEKQDANPVLVDMYIMLDRSDSMRGVTGTGVSKWDAMRTALSAFIADPASNGLGVGLQYFPLGVEGVPTQCGADADCTAAGGLCGNRFCEPGPFTTTFVPTLCQSDAECERPSVGCHPMGLCELDNTVACFDIGPGNCDQFGDCLLLAGQCADYATCDVGAYSDPAVPIDTLPANGGALINSLVTEMPIGLTPTKAALSGAIERAAQHAADNKTHRVITVLATDGLPTVCAAEPVTTEAELLLAVQEVTAVAADGLAQKPSIQTYVIGVFAPDDPDSMTKLDDIARAGGTDKAFIVDASQDVAQQLGDALAKIRGGSLDCEFHLPDAPDGEMLDYQLVNVEVTSDGTAQDLLYVRTADDCGKAELGWYYDVDPQTGDTPTLIRVCEQTCTKFHGLPNASVEIKLGCATRGPD